MTKTKDPFTIKITLRHPFYSPESISKALSLKPELSHAVGKAVAKVPAKWSLFHACLQKGNYASEVERALDRVVLFLEKHETFWTDFAHENGEVELVLNHTICSGEKGYKCLKLYLAPDFLRHLSSRGIGLEIQGWMR